ncbi:methylenetetrahydrofolate reductase isoform X1 [Nasonia vitripennis]|uniref:Methylenetetrahydrofolate reductase (NAD(P)H) n=1 Tax=Nasonia vitripennis TaxID=7425 RepID=A0A7M7H3Y9_NASVI|nr:methylenetetrahydrofolate reductase isoform X1 [Nasonia vitripennis]
MYLRRVCRLASVGRVSRRSLDSSRGMRHRVLGDEEPQVDESESVLASATTLDPGPPVNLAGLIREKIERRESFCSYELFPTKCHGVYQGRRGRRRDACRFFRDTQICEPLFYALTWHEGWATGEERFPSLKSAEVFPRNTLLHCTAKGLKKTDAEMILTRALELGIANIFALQGDSGSDDGDFDHASDLVKFIRERYGQQFSICVAGYPEMHPHSPSKELDIFYLKAKVDAGADFILTQFFFESQLFIKFVNDCREVGISVPIIPGIYPFTDVKLLGKMIEICHTNIPDWIQEELRHIEDDDEAVRKFGIDLSVKLIKEIRESAHFCGYHVYTLNRSFSAIEVHRQLNTQHEIDQLVASNS